MKFLKSNYKQLFICLFFAFVVFQAMPLRANGDAESHQTIEHIVQEQLTTPPTVIDLPAVSSGDVIAVPNIITEPPNTYRAGPDDEIKITVFGEEDLTGRYAVNGNGYISMPLIGDISVGGLSLKEIENAIVAKLKDGYVLDPRVSVEITKYRPFYILGEVRVPAAMAM
jgi:protein involved in polysaccharide export with SLBB domain